MPRDTSVWFLLLSVFGVLASVWLVVELSDDPMERTNLPDEAMLAATTMIPGEKSPWIGISLAMNEKTLRPREGTPNGVLVSRVMLGSPAAQAGIQAGDLVERIDGSRTRMPGDIMKTVVEHKVGDTVGITINRAGRSRKLFVTLGAQPMGTLAAATAPAQGVWIGADIQGVDKLLADQLGLPNTRGVVVSYVYPDSPAVAAGLVQGDVIRRVGETRLRDVNQLKSLIRLRKPGDVLRLSVWHNGGQKDVDLKVAQTPPPKDLPPPPTLPEAQVEIEAAWLGLDIVPLTKAEAEELGIKGGVRGMVVDGVIAGTGVDAGFMPGDVIIAVNGKPTPTVRTFKEATEEAVGAVVDVVRSGRHLYITVPPPGGNQAAKGQSPPLRQVALRTW